MLGDSWGFPAGTLQVFRAERVERKSLVGSPDSLIISCTIWCSKLRMFVYIQFQTFNCDSVLTS